MDPVDEINSLLNYSSVETAPTNFQVLGDNLTKWKYVFLNGSLTEKLSYIEKAKEMINDILTNYYFSKEDKFDDILFCKMHSFLDNLKLSDLSKSLIEIHFIYTCLYEAGLRVY